MALREAFWDKFDDIAGKGVVYFAFVVIVLPTFLVIMLLMLGYFVASFGRSTEKAPPPAPAPSRAQPAPVRPAATAVQEQTERLPPGFLETQAGVRGWFLEAGEDTVTLRLSSGEHLTVPREWLSEESQHVLAGR